MYVCVYVCAHPHRFCETKVDSQGSSRCGFYMDRNFRTKDEWASMITLLRFVKEKLTDIECDFVVHYDMAVNYGCPVNGKNEPLVKGRLETRRMVKVKEEVGLLPSGK